MLTSQNEWKILECDVKPQTNKQTNKQTTRSNNVIIKFMKKYIGQMEENFSRKCLNFLDRDTPMHTHKDQNQCFG